MTHADETGDSSDEGAGSVPPRISVIIPVLNEEKIISDALCRVTELVGIHEVIVVDGGSHDRTAEIVASFKDVIFHSTDASRARQMNHGAAVATGEILLFLHVDVRLPADVQNDIHGVMGDEKVVAGAYRTWTIADGPNPPLWAPLLHLADIRSRYTSTPYGDQAIFVRATIFNSVGGFPDIPLMEDYVLSQRLRQCGKTKTLRKNVLVSGRRFIAKPIFYSTIINIFPLLYGLGVPPRILKSLYRHER